MMSKLKLYFTCALSGLPIEHRERMIAVRETLKNEFEVLEFCDPKETSPQEIYRWDIHRNIATADFLVSMVDERAIGLGYEMGVMIEKYGKPVLALAHESAVVSPFVLGIDHPSYEFYRYQRLAEVETRVIHFAARYFPDFTLNKNP